MLLFILGFGFRVVLITQYPEVYSWDAFRRIWNYDHILVRHWLPFFQLVLFLFLKAIPSLFWLRIFVAFISGLTCGSAYLLGQRLFNRNTGLIWATMLAFSPLFVRFSLIFVICFLTYRNNYYNIKHYSLIFTINYFTFLLTY